MITITSRARRLYAAVTGASSHADGRPRGSRPRRGLPRAWTAILVLAVVAGVAAVARAEPFPAPDPPLVHGVPPSVSPDTADAVRAPAAMVEWTGHRTPDGLHPDGNEQAMMWLMNRARQNPAAEGVWLATSSEFDVESGRTFFMVDTALLQAEFAAIPPRPPAAFDVRLYNAAAAHSEDLIARDAQDHEGQIARVTAAGFSFTTCRLSVFSFSRSGLNAHAALNIDWGPGDGTGMQPGRGHRIAIMSSQGDLTNVGLAMVPDSNPGTNAGPLVFSGNYCNGATTAPNTFNRFLVGTVWQDQNGNGRYDPGEGFGGVTVMPDRGDFFAVTASGGGYAIPVTEAGNYAVTFSGGALPQSATLPVTVGAGSALLDHLVGAGPVAGPLVAAILPSSRSVQVGTAATVFATMTNAGGAAASTCAPTLTTSLPAAFSYQTTDPATNQLIGTPSTPATLTAGGTQTFVLVVTPSSPFAPTEVTFSFGCAGTTPAGTITGVNTLLLSAAATPIADIIAIGSTLGGNGIVDVPGGSSGVFAVASSNVGATGTITVSADTGGVSLPLALTVCETDATAGACVMPPGPAATISYTGGSTRSFGIFVQGTGAPVPFDPATNRIFVRFRDGSGIVRGATSVAVRGQ